MVDTNSKPKSKAVINANPSQSIERHVGRIPVLRSAIEEATLKGQHERVASLQAELDRRIAEVNNTKALLDTL